MDNELAKSEVRRVKASILEAIRKLTDEKAADSAAEAAHGGHGAANLADGENGA